MLEVDYELNRQEGAGHERIFHVDEGLKTINSNAIYIEAPNAKGKSTFLNILAIALYGDRLDETDSRISQSLRSDIKYMTERENQNYTFKVIIKSKDESIQLISTKANPNSDDIEVKEIINGKERFLPLSTFRDEYFLIYDIPEDPLNRITEILS
ncbi:MAG: AAA family ATPase, partial [Nanoarchaeota archaeon]|nr:AAA family ATPase [Nanoarchaeota archaeon]